MSVEQLKIDAIDAAQKYKARYKQTLDPNDLDMFKRFMDVYNHLDGIGGGGVDKIIAGANISISPTGGTGEVTISAIDISIDPTGYGSFFSSQTQAISTIDTPQVVTFNNTYEANNISLSSNRIVFDKAGTYQFAYVAQIFNTANSIEHCSFWIKYNGVDFPNSATHITVQPRKSSTEPSEQQMKLILSGTAQNDGDYIELYWQGTTTNLSLGYVAAGPGESPVNSPSVIANIIPIGAQGRDSNLNELNDVLITSPLTGQLLRYNSGTWENWTPNFLTTVPTLDQVTTAGNSTTNAITVGGLTVDTNTLVVDSVNNRVGIRTATPNDVFVVTNSSGEIRFGGGNGRTLSAYFTSGGLANFDFLAVQTYFNSDFLIAPNKKISTSNGSTDNLYLTTTDVAKAIYTDRNILIGTSINSIYRLDVNGIARVQGVLTANSFVKVGGTSSQFLKADGSIDSTAYLTSYSETDTLTTVTNRGNITINAIAVKSTSLRTALQVGNQVIDNDGYGYDSDSLMVVHQTPTSASVLNDPKEVLLLARQGTGGQAYGAAASFRISRYENSSTNSRTRLDLVLANSAFINYLPTTVMTLLSSGNVGIGTGSPQYKLQVQGDIYAAAGHIHLHRYGGNGGGSLFFVTDDPNHALWNGFYGADPKTSTGGSSFDGMYWRTYRGIRIKGGGSGAYNLITAEGSNGPNNDHVVKLYAANVSRIETTITGAYINGNLGIGTTTPSAKLDVAGVVLSADSSGYGFYTARKNNHFTQNAYFNGTNWLSYGSTAAYGSAVILQTGGEVGNAFDVSVDTSISGVNEALTFSTIMRVKTNGNVLIGTTTDAGYKLDVNGTARFSGNMSVVSSTPAPSGGTTNSPILLLQGSIWNSAVGPTNMSGGMVMTNRTYPSAGNNLNPPVSKLSFLVGTNNATATEKMSVDSDGRLVVVGGFVGNAPTVNNTYNVTLDHNGLATSGVSLDSNKLVFKGRAWNSAQGSVKNMAYLVVKNVVNNSNPTVDKLSFFVGSASNANTGDVDGNATERLALRTDGITSFYNSSVSETLRLTDAGDLLIGTTIDTGYKLEVNGNVKVSGTIEAVGGTSADWNTAFGWGDHSTAGYLQSGVGWSGTIMIASNPPGMQNIDVVDGLIMNVF